MKQYIPLLLGTLIAPQSFAESTCYFENGAYRSGNTIETPIMVTSGNSWTSTFMITNVSEKPVSVKLSLTDVNGNQYSPTTTSFFYNFDGTNNPLTSATLQPGAMGKIIIKDPQTDYLNVGEISWESDECLPEALMVTLFNEFSTSARYESGKLILNNGMPF